MNELFNALPDVLDAKALAHALSISKSGAYTLLNQKDFPTLRIGGRKLVTKPDLICWIKLLRLASPLDKEQRAALKTERAQLEAERETLLPKLEEVKAELAELNRIRYWTRKVILDALPRVSDGRVSVEDAMETAINRKELKETTETAAQTVLKRNREESVQHVLLRSHPPEL